MTATTYDTDRRAVLDAACAFFDSIGQLLLCVDGDLRIVYAPVELRELVGIPVSSALGSEVDSLLRLGRRAETRALLRTSRGTRGVAVTLAPFVPRRDGDNDIKYVMVVHAFDEPETERTKIIAALEANRWRRDASARALGVSRATLWRKMREHGLL